MMLNQNIKLSTVPETRISPRVCLIDISTIRALRGCDAEKVLDSVVNAAHPKFLRWVFNVAVKPVGIRNLRFWRDEVLADGQRGGMDKDAAPETVIEKILGQRRDFPRGEIEVQWTINAMTISRLIRAGEITETKQGLTRDSLANFLKRRLQ